LKAIFLEKIGEELIIKNIDVPSPEDDWVLVKIVRTGVCYRDILTAEGFFPKVRLPLILGHEISGIVVEVGKNVSKVSVGDKVVSLPYIPCGKCEYCREGRENICKNRIWYGEIIDGSYSEYVLVHKNSIIKMEPEVDWNYAAISSCVIGMVIHAIEDLGGISQGMKVLVTGAGGGVGIHAIQIAKALGGEVVAITSSEEKVGHIESLKPDHILLSSGDFSRDVKGLVGGVDIALDTVGQPTFIYSLKSLKWGGRLAVIGNVTVKPVDLQLGLIILRENIIHGVISSTMRTLKKALELGAKGLIKPIGIEMRLEDVPKAHEMIKRRNVLGRVFLKP
jgi:acryloyl-coenzyme A reductase